MASYEATDFCWQKGLYFLQHMRPSHIFLLRISPQLSSAGTISLGAQGSTE